MIKKPIKSPWGKVQHCETLCTGVYMVDTEKHGGVMVSKDISAFLSPAALKCSFKQNGYICFDADSQEDVALRELLDKKLWSIPARVRNKAAFEENINNNVRKHNPDYWRARELGRMAAPPAKAMQVREATR